MSNMNVPWSTECSRSYWSNLSIKDRTAITKKMGFGDYKVYARYNYGEFQPHTRVDLDGILESHWSASKQPLPRS